MLPGEAYAKFGRCKKREDEFVETYLADLRRPMRISGHKEVANEKDLMLVEQLLVGLPQKFANQIRLSIAASASGMTISEVTAQARALCNCASDLVEPVAAAAAVAPSRLCYEYNFAEHLRRDCPRLTRVTGRAQGRVQCYQCQKFGHVRRNCPELKRSSAGSTSGPGNAGTSAACLSLLV